jgi:transcriptional regulator with XRE-family HTH domain
VRPSEPRKIQTDTDIGQAIRDRRKHLGMSQEALSSLSGIAQPNLSKIERGMADARLDTYLKLCFLLGIDLVAVTRS